MLLSAYREFEKRAGVLTTIYGAKSQMIVDAIDRLSGNFRVADIHRICPGVSVDLIRSRLKELKRAGKVEPSGRGPKAVWRKVG
jgi:DNA-binding HxlR family transcriptional regulator